MWEQMPVYDRRYAPRKLRESYQMTHSMSINPQNPDEILIGTDTSRVFRSTDNGQTWIHSSNGLISMGVRTLVHDPINPQRIIAAAFAGVDAASVTSSSHHAIYNSLDGGVTWTLVKVAKFVRQGAKDPVIAYDSSSSDGTKMAVWFAGDYDAGLLKSIDGGTIWRVIEPTLTGIKCITEVPGAPGEFYITTDTNLYRYTKTQTTTLGTGLPATGLNSVVSLPDDSTTVFVAHANGIYRSYDSGATFNGGDLVAGTANIQSLAVSKVAPYILYGKKAQATSGNSRLPMYSTDRGQTWQHGNYAASIPAADYGEYFYWSSILVPDPNDAYECTVIASGDGKCFKTVDGGVTWNLHGNGYTGIRVNKILFSDDMMYLASTDFSIWKKARGPGSDDFYDQISETDLPRYSGEKTIFLLGRLPSGLHVATVGSYTSQCITFEQSNGTWTNETTQNGNFKRLTVAPNGNVYVDNRRWDGAFTTISQNVYAANSSNTLYTIVTSGPDLQVMTSTNNGDTWGNFGGPLLQEDGTTVPPLSSIKEIRIDPHDETVLYIASARSFWVYDGSSDNKTGHAANTWVQMADIIGYPRDPNGSRSAIDVAMDPYKPGRLFVGHSFGSSGASMGVLMTEDYGQTWVNITEAQYSALAVYSIQIDPWLYQVVIDTDIGLMKYQLNL